MTANALTSLWGQGHFAAQLAHANKMRTRECVDMPGLRNPTILTPPCIIEAVLKVWPEGIALDPCAETGQGAYNVPAAQHITGETTSGLERRWPYRTYVNPPFGKLRPWLEKAATCDEVMVLCPVRTHRKWFRLDQFHAVCFLNPLSFVGFKQAFPAPLCLMYRGSYPALFARTFHDLGRVCVVEKLQVE